MTMKSHCARAIIEAAPTISTQIVNETIAVLTTKYRFSKPDAYEVATALMDLCEVVAVSQVTVRNAMRLAIRYQLSHWDSLVIAASLEANCDVLYSEDMHDGLVIDDRLTIKNPFVP